MLHSHAFETSDTDVSEIDTTRCLVAPRLAFACESVRWKRRFIEDMLGKQNVKHGCLFEDLCELPTGACD